MPDETAETLPEAGLECPSCQSGTIEYGAGEARCMGECGAVWGLPCARSPDTDPDGTPAWGCDNDHTGCLWNDGHNTCMHEGDSSSPLEDTLEIGEVTPEPYKDIETIFTRPVGGEE